MPDLHPIAAVIDLVVGFPLLVFFLLHGEWKGMLACLFILLLSAFWWFWFPRMASGTNPLCPIILNVLTFFIACSRIGADDEAPAGGL